MNGRELAIRRVELRPGIRTLSMSDYTANTLVHQDDLKPGADFLQKPVCKAVLCAKIRALLDAQPV